MPSAVARAPLRACGAALRRCAHTPRWRCALLNPPKSPQHNTTQHKTTQLARFDFSFGEVAEHQAVLDNLREAMRRTGRLCATAMDTLGPEIVVLNRAADGAPIALEAGQTLRLACDASLPATSTCLPISYPSLHDAGLQPGRHIFVGQYLFTGSETTSAYLTVQSIAPDGRSVDCLVANSCVLEGVQLTVHFGNMSNAAPILCERDRAALREFGARNAVDFVALSFTRSAADIKEARAFLDSVGMRGAKIIAKVESKEGLLAYREIVEAADALVLSRGSMGNCLDPEVRLREAGANQGRGSLRFSTCLCCSHPCAAHTVPSSYH